MKTILNSIVFTALLGATGCTSSPQKNEAASDTASVLDTTRSNSSTDTSAVQDVKGTGTTQSTNPAQYEEANGKQSPRTNVGADTTGKQPHDNQPK